MPKAQARFYENADDGGRLYFYMRSPSIADINAEPFIFDGPATEQHKAGYAVEHASYLQSKEITPEAVIASEVVSEITGTVEVVTEEAPAPALIEE